MKHLNQIKEWKQKCIIEPFQIIGQLLFFKRMVILMGTRTKQSQLFVHVSLESKEGWNKFRWFIRSHCKLSTMSRAFYTWDFFEPPARTIMFQHTLLQLTKSDYLINGFIHLPKPLHGEKLKKLATHQPI